MACLPPVPGGRLDSELLFVPSTKSVVGRNGQRCRNAKS